MRGCAISSSGRKRSCLDFRRGYYNKRDGWNGSIPTSLELISVRITSYSPFFIATTFNRLCTGFKLMLGSKVQCLFFFNCTAERRGGKKRGEYKYQNKEHRTFDPRITLSPVLLSIPVEVLRRCYYLNLTLHVDDDDGEEL